MTAGKHDTMVTVAREKRQAEFETYLRRMMKRFNKELLEDTHKVGVHVCVSECSRFFILDSCTRCIQNLLLECLTGIFAACDFMVWHY